MVQGVPWPLLHSAPVLLLPCALRQAVWAPYWFGSLLGETWVLPGPPPWAAGRTEWSAYMGACSLVQSEGPRAAAVCTTAVILLTVGPAYCLLPSWMAAVPAAGHLRGQSTVGWERH